jgi:hypothetical protein
VEFGLVVPILIVLVAAVGDLGRIFATGILLESAARNGAEVAANEYLAEPPGSDASPPVLLNAPAPSGDSAYYTALHDKVVQKVCSETQELPNAQFDTATGRCPGMPYVLVCVHDSQDTNCGSEAQGATPSAFCNELSPAPANAHGGTGTPRWVEVRVCYRYTSLLALPWVSFGEFWLQRTRTFAIPCYFALGNADECG